MRFPGRPYIIDSHSERYVKILMIHTVKVVTNVPFFGFEVYLSKYYPPHCNGCLESLTVGSFIQDIYYVTAESRFI